LIRTRFQEYRRENCFPLLLEDYQMNSRKLSLAGLIVAVSLAACGGNRSNTLPEDGGFESGAAEPGASTVGAGEDSGIGVFEEEEGSFGGPAALRDQLVVYFEFDTSDIRTDFNSMLAAHGQYLASNAGAQVRLEGHADERGSREYNIGLGERRAQAVRRVLMLQGATADQLSTVSYGEERPTAIGSDEQSYGLNRRVELVYR
jgi:peptidoglycan-associated lipoprotein